MNLKVLNRIDGSFNLNFTLKGNDVSDKWVAKISRRLPNNLNFSDLDERAILASRLAGHLNTKVPESKYIKESEIKPSRLRSKIFQNAKTANYYYNPEKILITKFKGKPLPLYLEKKGFEKIQNIDELIKSFVFDLWIGNYDKKDEDYVVMNSGEAYSIDYNLCGPGFRNDDNSSIGFLACKYSICNIGDTGYAVGEILRKKIISNKYAVSFFEDEISKIENLTLEEITIQFSQINIQRESTNENINQVFIDFLVSRQKLLRNMINEWLTNGCPKTYKDPNNCR